MSFVTVVCTVIIRCQYLQLFKLRQVFQEVKQEVGADSFNVRVDPWG